MPEFTAQIVRLEELFAKRCAIAAPDYQRAFAWTAVEAGQLLEDLASAADDSSGRGPEDYFLGTMLFIDREAAALERRRVWQRGASDRGAPALEARRRRSGGQNRSGERRSRLAGRPRARRDHPAHHPF